MTWIASSDKKVEESRNLGIVDSGKFVHSGRLRAPAVHGVSRSSRAKKANIQKSIQQRHW